MLHRVQALIDTRENGMTGRTALVTGGTGCIGRQICETLAAAGYRVAANGHPADAEAAARWQQEAAGRGLDIHLEAFDAGDYEATLAGVAAVEAAVGPVDVLVNAAGITRDGRLVNLDPEDWKAVVRTNLDSVYNATKAVIGGMIGRSFGRVVNISSVNGQRGQFGQANYSAKAGVHGFTMAMAREVARKGVTVNTVSPGYIESPLIMKVPEPIRESIRESIPAGRFGKPEEIARAVLFLASDDAAYITGADLSVNGGYHMD
ncbi:MAG TPA: acetoacetyl-CoA reductase [Gammaproteobacteria bacterium]|nr:acetoacetyl-CoA reductase [Gammaproteobacteria bacterium]